MSKKSISIKLAICLCILSTGLFTASLVAAFPTTHIRYVNHNSPGSGTDRVARMTAKIIEEHKLSPVSMTVENKPGGSGEIARSYVAQHAGDAHYLMTIQPTSISVPMQRASKFTWDYFTPICNLLVDSNVIVVRYESPYKTIKDLMEKAKKEPNTISFAGNSMGGIEYFAKYLLDKTSGAKTKFLAVEPTAQIPGILGGHMDVMSANPDEVDQLVKAKKLRILALLSEERNTLYPDVPTAREQGYDVVLYSFRGVTAAGNISEAEAAYHEKVFEKAVQTDQFKKYATAIGAELKYMPRKQFVKYLKDESVKYEEILKEAGLYKPYKP